MPMHFTIDKIFGDFERILRKFPDLNGLRNAIEEGKLEGNWNLEQIDEPYVKGYMIRGRFELDQFPEPLDPIEPLVRRRRPPLPGRFFETQENALHKTNEPLVDIFDREKDIKVYIELPHTENDDVQLNVTKGGIEVKTKSFYKVIKVPENINIEKASSKQKNRVLEVTIPKYNEPKNETKRILIE